MPYVRKSAGYLVPQQINTHGAKNDALRAMRVLRL